LLHYVGVLMTQPLFTQFNQHYYCPTSVSMPELNFGLAGGVKEEVTLMGDPVEAGSMVNDGSYSNLQSTTQHAYWSPA